MDSTSINSIRRTYSNTKESFFRVAFHISNHKRRDFLSLLLVTLQFLQIIGLVINPLLTEWHSIFDPRSFLSLLTIPVYYKSYDLPILLYGYFSSAVVLIVLALFLYFTHISFIPDSALSRTLSFLYHSLSTVLFLPTASILLSSLSCQSKHNSLFSFGFPTDQCWAFPSILSRSLFFISLLLLYHYGMFFNRCLYPFSPLCKKVWCRSHSKFNVFLFHSKVSLLLIRFLLPQRQYLFHFSYMTLSIVITLLFSLYVPFYQLRSNRKFSFLCGIWCGVGIPWFLHVYFLPSIPLLNTLMFLFSMLSGGLIASYIAVKRYNYFTSFVKKSRSPKYTPHGILFPAPSNSLGLDISIFIPDFGSDATSAITEVEEMPDPKWIFVIELYTRFLFPKPENSPFKELGCVVFERCKEKYPENPDFLLLWTIFDVFVRNNVKHKIYSHFKNSDIEASFFQKYLAYAIQAQISSIREVIEISTPREGQNQSDLLSKLKEAYDLHEKCLLFMFCFWDSIFTDNSNIRLLPELAEKLNLAIADAESVFDFLLCNYPENKDVLKAFAKFAKDVLEDGELAMFYMEQLDYADASENSSVTSLVRNFKNSENYHFLSQHRQKKKSQKLKIRRSKSVVRRSRYGVHAFFNFVFHNWFDLLGVC
ncbi:hypothetical protein GEMRC1_005822 [Eukaryota sp. GEM-RC1]